MKEIGQYRVVVALPTRGLIFAQTISSLIDNGVQDICIVEGLPLPECHNEAVKRALEKKPTHVWMVEEDHYYPPGTLKKMLDLNAEVACVNYSMRPGGTMPAIQRRDNRVWFCGTGCMLVESSIFDRLPEPWFETDKTFDFRTKNVIDRPRPYGGHDVYFGVKMEQMGVEIMQVPDYQVSHLRCTQLDRIENNEGCYSINEIDKLVSP